MQHKRSEDDLSQMQVELRIESIKVVLLETYWFGAQVLESIEVGEDDEHTKDGKLAKEFFLEDGFVVTFLRLFLFERNGL